MFCQSYRRDRRRAAFTIVELLVVIAVIAILMSVLVPALGQARKQARDVVCLTRLRAIGFAMKMYADQNRDYIPRSGGSWPYLFMPYVGGVSEDMTKWFEVKTYDCPAFPAKEQCLDYCVNNWAAPGTTKNSTKMSSFPRAETTIFLTDYESGPPRKVVLKSDDWSTKQEKFRSFDISDPYHLPLPRQPNEEYEQDINLRRVARERHKWGANALFLDTHGEWVSTMYNNRWHWGMPAPTVGDVDYVANYTKVR